MHSLNYNRMKSVKKSTPGYWEGVWEETWGQNLYRSITNLISNDAEEKAAGEELIQQVW